MQEEIGIGDRHLRPAFAITDRPGVGAGAERTNAPAGIRVYPGNGTSASADRGDIDHRGAEWISADLAVRGKHRLPGLDEGDIG